MAEQAEKKQFFVARKCRPADIAKGKPAPYLMPNTIVELTMDEAQPLIDAEALRLPKKAELDALKEAEGK